MDIININNSSSGHFDSENILDRAPSVRDATQPASDSGKFENGKTGVTNSDEKCRRKRKTRRFKSRYKGKQQPSSFKKSKYNGGGGGSLKKMRSRVYPQSEAPYNTNQFLMADHHNLENLDDKLSVPNNYFKENSERASRMRESSFTSADSDDGQFYSSPEDEDEFLTKDFDNTYQSVCAEKFGNYSKAQLTKVIFDLEAKIEELTKRTTAIAAPATQRPADDKLDVLQVNGAATDSRDVRIDMKDMWLENERLRVENEELRRFIKENAVTTTSSSSSSSSADSDSDSSSEEDSTGNRTSAVEDTVASKPSSNSNDDPARELT